MKLNLQQIDKYEELDREEKFTNKKKKGKAEDNSTRNVSRLSVQVERSDK